MIGEAVHIIGQSFNSPLVAHIPHSSSRIPTDLLPTFTCGEHALAQENRLLVDWFTEELFDFVPHLGGTSLIYQVSRFVCDPERFERDDLECMSARGMGALYTHGVHQDRIRADFTEGEREALLKRFYRPHHTACTEVVEQCLKKFGLCLILDCHSYPQHPLPYELFHDAPRPEICIGTDEQHTPKALIQCLENSAQQAGYQLSINSPFKGTLVPLKFLGDPRVYSLMFEIRRDMYMDEARVKKNTRFQRLKNWLSTVSETLLREL